jgi:hypothetical protein
METLLDVRLETGVAPPALRNRPALKSQNRHLLEAFYEVSAGRSVGAMAPQPLTSADVLNYCELMGIRSQRERERLFYIVRRLDPVYLRHVAKTLEASQPNK